MVMLNSTVGEHEFYCCGSKVLIKNGDVKVLTEPRIVHCPLLEAFYGVRKVDREAVKNCVRMKVEGFGFCCRDRAFDPSMVVPYGSSEIISTCMRDGLIDCAVTVCEGAGTVISNDPRLVQEIGARLTGIMRTTPIGKIIEHIKGRGGVVLNESTAEIDQFKGVVKAVELGFKRIAVTVAHFDSKSIEYIRRFEKESHAQMAIFSVCNTCATEEDAERVLNGADVVCASASRIIREKVGSKALMQLGVAIPVFALTKLGKRLLLTYLMDFDENIIAFRSRKMPYMVEGRGPTIRE
jgi:putative methanogenesis marker protein 8